MILFLVDRLDKYLANMSVDRKACYNLMILAKYTLIGSMQIPKLNGNEADVNLRSLHSYKAIVHSNGVEQRKNSNCHLNNRHTDQYKYAVV